MSTKKYKAVLLDLDGTLLNTLDDLADIVNHTMRKFGYNERTVDEVKSFVGNGVVKLIELSTPGGRDNPQFDEIVQECRAYYDIHASSFTRPYPGVCDVIERLHAAGLKVGCVTNKLHSTSVKLCEKFFPSLDAVCGEREKEGIRRKPYPDMVAVAANEMGVSVDDCIYVGDSEVDIATAHNSGIKCVSVLWGYRERDYLAEMGADMFASDADELFNHICG